MNSATEEILHALKPRFDDPTLVGEGASARVYKVMDQERGEWVALKSPVHGEPGTLKREFRFGTDLVHPNIVRPYELFELEHRACFTMEYVEGPNLLEWVRRSGELRIGRLQTAFAGLVSALTYLHDRGVLHGDLKPENVRVRKDESVVIIDFGAASQSRALAAHTLGTPAYSPPEQLLGAPWDKAADWYSIGVILHRCLTGEFPPRATPGTLGVAMPLPVDDSLFPKEVPSPLKKLCGHLLHPRSADRAGAHELNAALGEPRFAPQSAGFIGRIAEIKRLHAKLTEDASASVYVLAGESGIGKTSLLTEFAGRIAPSEFAVIESRCSPRESVVFRAFDEPMDALASRIQRSPEQQRRRLLGQSTALLATLFPVFRSLLPASESDESTALDLNARRRGFRETVRLLDRAAEGRRLVFVVDDWHWSDPGSRELLLHLLTESVRAPLLIVSTRPLEGPADEWLATLAEHSVPVERVTLGSLTRADALAMAVSRRGSDANIEQLVDDSAGHPFFIDALCRHPNTAESLSLRAHVASILTSLSTEAQRLVAAVSMAHQGTDADLALEVAQAKRTVLEDLVAKRLLQELPGNTRRVDLAHDTWRQVLDELGAGEVEALHLRFATILTRQSEVDWAGVAHHYERAGRQADAASAALKAAESQLARLNFESAEASFLQAIANGVVDVARVRIRYANALALAGRRIDAARLLVQSAAELPEDKIHLQLRATEFLLSAGAMEEGIGVLKPMLAGVGLSHPGGNALALMEVVAGLARLRFAPRRAKPLDEERLALCLAPMKGLSAIDPVRSTTYAMRALSFARRLGDRQAEIFCRSYLGLVLGFSGVKRLETMGARMVEEAMKASESDDAAARTWVRAVRGIQLVGRCRWREGYRQIQVAFDEDDGSRADVHWEKAAADTTQLLAVQSMGDYRQLEDHARRLLDVGEARNDLFVVVESNIYLADALLAADRPARARRTLEAAMERWHAESFAFQDWLGAHVRIRIMLYERQEEAAREEFERAVRLAKKEGMLNVRVVALHAAQLAIGIDSLGESRATDSRIARWTKGDLDWAKAIAARAEREPRHEQTAQLFRSADMETHALTQEWRADPANPRPIKELRARGVANPQRWSVLA